MRAGGEAWLQIFFKKKYMVYFIFTYRNFFYELVIIPLIIYI